MPLCTTREDSSDKTSRRIIAVAPDGDTVSGRIPQRQFIGDHERVREAITAIMTRHLERVSRDLTKITRI